MAWRKKSSRAAASTLRSSRTVARWPAIRRTRGPARPCAASASRDHRPGTRCIADSSSWTPATGTGPSRRSAKRERPCRARPPPCCQGICHYELGEDAEATRAPSRGGGIRASSRGSPVLSRPRRAPGGRRAGGDDALRVCARERRARARRDRPRAARSSGRARRRLAARRVRVGLEREPRADREPSLAPESDGVLRSPGASSSVRKGRGPYLRASGLLHQPLSSAPTTSRALDVAAGWQLRGRGRQLVAEYDFGSRTFGGEPYVTAHRLLASGWLRAGRVALGGTYLARFESYATEWSPFDGVFQRAEVRAAATPRPELRVALAYGVARDHADGAVLSYTEHGPRAELGSPPGANWRLGLDAALSLRDYDEFDPSLSRDATRHLPRRDRLGGARPRAGVGGEARGRCPEGHVERRRVRVRQGRSDRRARVRPGSRGDAPVPRAARRRSPRARRLARRDGLPPPLRRRRLDRVLEERLRGAGETAARMLFAQTPATADRSAP